MADDVKRESGDHRRTRSGPDATRPPGRDRRGARASSSRAGTPATTIDAISARVRRPGRDGVPALLVEARHPQGTPRHLDRRRRRTGRRAGPVRRRRPASPSPTRPRCSPGSPASRPRSTSGPAASTASSSVRPAPTPAAAELLGVIHQQRDEGQRRIARVRSPRRRAPRRLRERDAADLIHALMSPDVYRLLVVDRGWKPERYRSGSPTRSSSSCSEPSAIRSRRPSAAQAGAELLADAGRRCRGRRRRPARGSPTRRRRPDSGRASGRRCAAPPTMVPGPAWSRSAFARARRRRPASSTTSPPQLVVNEAGSGLSLRTSDATSAASSANASGSSPHRFQPLALSAATSPTWRARPPTHAG